jgi:hypothetical protein
MVKGSPMPKPLLVVVFAVTFSLSMLSTAFAQDSVIILKNADIITMVRAKLPAALIIEKINTSSCSFDTFPSVLAEMKYKGVPDEVLMAMVHAPHGGRPKVVTEPKPEPRTEVKAAENLGGFISSDRRESPYNARFFIAPMEEGFDGLISALMIEKKLPLSIVADQNNADFIIVGGTNKGTHKWYDTVFGSGYERDRNQGSIRVIRVRDKTVIWGAQKGDRSLWWGALKKGGKRKVAERLVNEMKDDLFKDRF